MAQAELRRRMRSVDAMFLYFEKKEMPLHIGSVAVLDGPFDAECEKIVEARLPEIPRYRQRLMFSPLNLTHPAWEFDPEFDIRNHIRRVHLDPPGVEAQLPEISGRVFSELMDRSKPLWDLTVIDGLDRGRSALITRVHHCLVDGVSGIGLMNIMFDTTRTPRPVAPQRFCPPPLPTRAQVLVEGLASTWPDSIERLLGAQLAMMRFTQGLLGGNAMHSLGTLLSLAPELLRPAERLPFNGPCSGVRGHCWTTFSFGEARKIRTATCGTINDVALTTVAGAVSRYVTAHREPLKGRFVRIMVPVNLRTEDPRGSTGNEVSMLPMSIPLDIGDPVERMRVVSERSAAMKSARVADLIALIGSWLGWTPPALQNTLAPLPFLPQPVLLLNMVCTNVPGPMVPLYVNGRELLTYYPHVPIGSDIGIGVAIQSYNQKLHFGITYDAQAAPDGELFRDFLVESYEELREAAGVARAKMVPEKRPFEAARVPRGEELRSHRPSKPAASPEALSQGSLRAEARSEPEPDVAPEPEPTAAPLDETAAFVAEAVLEARRSADAVLSLKSKPASPTAAQPLAEPIQAPAEAPDSGPRRETSPAKAAVEAPSEPGPALDSQIATAAAAPPKHMEAAAEARGKAKAKSESRSGSRRRKTKNKPGSAAAGR